MKRFFNKLANMTIATLGNTLLITSGIAMTMCAVGLTAFYLVKYIDRSSPDIIDFQCSVLGIQREECPEHQDALNALQHDLDALAAQRAAFEAELAAMNKKLAGLYEIQEMAKGGINAFNTVPIPNSTFSVTIGTKYSNLIDNPHSKNVQYFCYIPLDNGELSESRHLHIRNVSGETKLDATKLKSEGITPTVLNDAMALCKPTIAGGD